jgi:hypothetical protein
MNRFLVASTFAVAFGVQTTVAMGQTPTCKDWHIDQDWKSDQIDIAYIEPTNPGLQSIYDGLKQRKILEELQEFLSPLRLPEKVLVKTEQCDAPGRRYEPGGPITICYEYLAKLATLVTRIPQDGTTARGVSRDDAMVGAFVQVVLNQMSHAVLYLQQIPVWGREPDAADKLAGFLMLQFPPETARKLLNGAAYFFEASAEGTWANSDLADVQSTELQRFYNYLCIAYGADPLTFKDFVQTSGGPSQASGSGGEARPDQLPQRRVPWCPREYNVFKQGFDIFIKPCLDQAQYEKVHDRIDWLQRQEGK